MVNEREFGVAFLEANITDNQELGTSTLNAHLDNIPPSVGEYRARTAPGWDSCEQSFWFLSLMSIIYKSTNVYKLCF